MSAPRNFSQPEDNQPVLKEGQVATRVTGFEAMGKAFGVGADLLFKQSEAMATEESNTHFLAAQSSVADAQAKAKLAILQNPDQGKTISDQLKLTTDAIKQSAFVNRSDRASLNKYADNSVRDTIFQAAKSQLEVAKAQIAFTTMSGWQDNVDEYNRLLYSQDPSDAIAQKEKMLGSLQLQVKEKIITPTQAYAMLEKMNEVHLRHDLQTKGYASGNMTPAQYHATLAGTPDQTINNGSLPTNIHTESQVNHINEYSSIADAQAERAQGRQVNPLSLSHVTNDISIADYYQFSNGCAVAEGMVYSGETYPMIQRRINELTHTQERSPFQNGELDRLTNVMNDIRDRGDVMKYVAEVKGGALARQKLSTELGAIDASPDSNVVKQARIDAAHNTYLTEMNSVMEGLKIPQQYRNIFPTGQVNVIRDNLFHGGNPAIAVSAIQGLRKDSVPYMANAMENSHQAMTVMTTYNLKGLVDPNFISNLVATQNEKLLGMNGQEPKAKLIQTKESGISNPVTDERIRADIYNDPNMKDTFDTLSYLPPVGNVSASEAQVEMGLRYVKGRAIMNGDLTLNNYPKYLNEYVTNIPKGYDRFATHKVEMDRKVIPLHPDEMTMVGDYILDGVYEDKKKEGYTDAEIDNMKVNDAYKVVSFPTHHLVVVDSNYHKIMKPNGEPYYDHLYLPTVLQAAKHSNRVEKELRQSGKKSLKEILEQ